MEGCERGPTAGGLDVSPSTILLRDELRLNPVANIRALPNLESDEPGKPGEPDLDGEPDLGAGPDLGAQTALSGDVSGPVGVGSAEAGGAAHMSAAAGVTAGVTADVTAGVTADVTADGTADDGTADVTARRGAARPLRTALGDAGGAAAACGARAHATVSRGSEASSGVLKSSAAEPPSERAAGGAAVWAGVVRASPTATEVQLAAASGVALAFSFWTMRSMIAFSAA
eukprot:scaffold8526_cov100-Isochrysis_galbana.AAC.1